MIGLFGFALAAAYVPWIVGAATTPRWAVLVLGAIALFWWLPVPVPMRRLGSAQIIGVLFVAWSLESVTWSHAPEAFDQAWKLLLLTMLFVVGSRLADLRWLLVGCAAGVGLSSALVILDRLGLTSYPQWVGPSGLFVNGLYLAEFAAMVAVGCLAYRAWWMAAVCAPSIMLVQVPRGPLVALLVAGWVALRVRRVSLWISAIPVLFLVLWLAALYRPDTVNVRFDMWSGIMRELGLAGHGLGSYFGDAPLLASARDLAALRPLHANNDLLEIAYEAGLIGAVLALAFVGTLVMRFDRTANPAYLVVVVFLVEGLFGFPFQMPATAGLFALTAGHLARSS